MRKIVILCLALGLAVFTTACGKVSDDQKRDISRVMMALQNDVGQGNLQTFDGVIADGKFTPAMAFPDGCPSNVTAEGMSCTSSCPTTSVNVMSCTIPSARSTTCGGVTYSITSGEVSVTSDLTNFTVNESSASGSMSFAIRIAANVSGGELKGERLDCTIRMVLDFAALTSGTVAGPSSACDGFSCTFDGNEISCEDMQKQSVSSCS